MRRLIVLILLVPLGCYAIWNWVQQDREVTWQQEMGKALSAHSLKHESEAEEILKGLLPKTEKWWPNGPHLVETVAWLGTIYCVEVKYDLAEPMLKRAIQLSEQQGLGPTIALGRSKFDLGIISRDQFDDVEAQRLFSEATEAFANSHAESWGDNEGALLNLGHLANKQGRYQDAESYLTRAVAGYKALYGNRPEPDMANAQFHLAETYRQLGRYDDAAEQYQASLNTFEQTEGAEGKDVRNVLTQLSLVQRGPDALKRSDDLIARSMTISEKLGDVDGTTLNNSAIIAHDHQQYLEAESLYRRACDAFEKSGGPNDVGLATALANLGKLYRDEQQFDVRKAEPLLRRALAIREKILGPEHPETAEVLSDLSLLYFYEKNLAAAEDFARRALPTEEKAFGAESLEVSTTLNRLGISERDLGKFDDAEATLKRALAIREADHAPDKWIATSLENLACVYALQGRTAKAAPLIERAQALRAHSVGDR